jgi:hypothetical protein
VEPLFTARTCDAQDQLVFGPPFLGYFFWRRKKSAARQTHQSFKNGMSVPGAKPYDARKPAVCKPLVIKVANT